MLTSLLAASNSAMPHPLPFVPGVVVDGNPADWAGAGLRVDAMSCAASLPPPSDRSRARASLGWDNLGLLFLVEVIDATPSEAFRASGAYLFDSVELFISSDPSRSENLQLIISPGTDPAHPVPRSFVYLNPTKPPSHDRDGISWAVAPRPDGYVVEARLPWSAVGAVPKPGLVIGTRVFVNDEDGAGTRVRHAWQPPDAPFHALELQGPGRVEAAALAAWLAIDTVEAAGRVNIVAASRLAGMPVELHQQNSMRTSVLLSEDPRSPSASVILRAPWTCGDFVVRGSDGTEVVLRNDFESRAAALVARAQGSWRATPAERANLAFARAAWDQHIFSGRRFPAFSFDNLDHLSRLLGAEPAVQVEWFDAEGRPVAAPTAAGRYGARSAITLPGRTRPIVVEGTLFRLPDGATVPQDDGETAATILAFSLQGADATPSHAARVAGRWWHRLRRAHGFAEPLPYRLFVPPGQASGPRALLVHLHGSGQNHDADAARFFRDVIAPLDDPDLLAVYPMSADSWRGPAVAEVIDAVAAEHDVDRHRIYLLGFSMGGIGAWEVALDMPERFAALAVVGGRMGSPADAALLRDVPVWVLNGAEDPTTTPEEAAIMVEALRQAGGDARFTLLPGYSHGDSQTAAYRYPGFCDWLRTQRRKLQSSTAAPTRSP
jgi:poly(3-hydroxybutyrate) depolymerase